MPPSRSNPPSLLTRLTASLGVALVLVLTVLAVSPALHAWLHKTPPTVAPCGHDHGPAPHAPDDDHDHNDDAGCVVTLFAHGGSELAAAPTLLVAPARALVGDLLLSVEFCAPSAPAHTLPPGCGPPAA
jgi:hypothetical protein